MHMKPIMEGWRGYLKEGQRGTAFEDVVVEVAKGNLTGGNSGGEEYEYQGTPTPFRELAIKCLRKMDPKLTDDQIAAGIDPNAKLFSTKGKGISGRPKTDIIIDGKRISLKLPDDIQFASGEGASTSRAVKLALDEYLQKQPQIMNETQRVVTEGLRGSVEEFNRVLGQTIGKLYLPVSGSEEYLLELAKKAKKDWTGNKKNPQGIWASAGIPKSMRDKGPPQIVYPGQEGLEEYIKYYQELALGHAWESDRLAGTSYKNFKSTTMKDIEKKAVNLATQSPDYYNIIIDEWLTGRRQFKGTAGVAEYLLSPDGFYPIKTTEQTAQLATEWKDYIKWRPAAKGRRFLSKAITIRVDFKAKKYYAALRKAAQAEAAREAEKVPTGVSGPPQDAATAGTIVNEGAGANSEVENIAQQMARELMPDVHLEINREIEPEAS